MQDWSIFAALMRRPSINQPYVIGISGASASGKTHFIRQLTAGFKEEELCVISQDNYYKPKEEQGLDEEGNINFDQPLGIDFERLLNDFESLKAGKTVKKPEYNFQNYDAEISYIELKPAPVVIIEGLFIFFNERTFSHFDLKLVIDADDDVKLQRRLARDTAERGIPEDYVIYQWKNHVFPAYEKYLMPFVPKADMVILNNDGFDNSLHIIGNHLRTLLNN